MSHRQAVTAALLLCLQAACADPNAASRENFGDALRRTLPERPLCIPSEGTYPRTVPVRSYKPWGGDWTISHPPKAEVQRLSALEDAGLIQRVDERTTLVEGPVREGEWTYDLTPAGRAAYRDSLPSASGLRQGFCAGPKELVEVTRYTEPADMLGMRYSEVAYTYRLGAVPEWIRHPKVREAFPQAAETAVRASEGPVEATQDFVLTGEGWVPADEVNR